MNEWQQEVEETIDSEDKLSLNSNECVVYYCAFAICLLLVINVIVSHPYFLSTYRHGMQVRIAVSHLIYGKLLKLNNSSLNQTTVGQVVNLLSNDVNRFDWSLVFTHYLIVGPIQMCVVTALLWNQIGISCLSGIIVLIFYIPIQAFMGHLFSKLRNKTALLTDERIRIMNEIIAAIRVIKMYVWETAFSKLVEKWRIREISNIKKSMFFRGINLALFFISSKLIAFICLIVFLISGAKNRFFDGSTLDYERV